MGPRAASSPHRRPLRSDVAACVTRQRGMSLLEVLVAIIVLSFGMLAYAGLQATALKAGKIGQFRTLATQLAIDYGDRMRANAVAAAAGQYSYENPYAEAVAAIAEPACALVPCTSAEIAAIDVARWRNLARLTLPGGSLYAELDGTAVGATVVDFWVVWRDPVTDDVVNIGQVCPDPEIGNDLAGLQCMHFRFTL